MLWQGRKSFRNNNSTNSFRGFANSKTKIEREGKQVRSSLVQPTIERWDRVLWAELTKEYWMRMRVDGTSPREWVKTTLVCCLLCILIRLINTRHTWIRKWGTICKITWKLRNICESKLAAATEKPSVQIQKNTRRIAARNRPCAPYHANASSNISSIVITWNQTRIIEFSKRVIPKDLQFWRMRSTGTRPSCKAIKNAIIIICTTTGCASNTTKMRLRENANWKSSNRISSRKIC